MKKPICIIAGVGNSTGTGAACAREFKDHRVAVLGRRAESLNQLVKEINEQGGEALAVPVSEYARGPLENAFETVAEKWPDSQLKLAIWNTSQWSRIPFLDVTEADVRKSADINILAAFAFSQSAVRAMLKHSQGGSLLVTGATSATRGAAAFSVFAAGKHASRAMTQSIAREFGPQGIHACYVIVDGTIATDATRRNFGSRADKDEGWLDDRTQSLSPVSIAKTYRWLHEQRQDCWTHELDLRPSKEHF